MPSAPPSAPVMSRSSSPKAAASSGGGSHSSRSPLPRDDDRGLAPAPQPPVSSSSSAPESRRATPTRTRARRRALNAARRSRPAASPRRASRARSRRLNESRSSSRGGKRSPISARAAASSCAPYSRSRGGRAEPPQHLHAVPVQVVAVADRPRLGAGVDDRQQLADRLGVRVGSRPAAGRVRAVRAQHPVVDRPRHEHADALGREEGRHDEEMVLEPLLALGEADAVLVEQRAAEQLVRGQELERHIGGGEAVAVGGAEVGRAPAAVARRPCR